MQQIFEIHWINVPSDLVAQESRKQADVAKEVITTALY